MVLQRIQSIRILSLASLYNLILITGMITVACMMQLHIPSDHETNHLVIIDPVTILNFVKSYINFNTVLLAHAVISTRRIETLASTKITV